MQNQLTQCVKVIICDYDTKPKVTQEPTALEKWQAMDLAGCGRAEQDLSVNYKTELRKDFKREAIVFM